MHPSTTDTAQDGPLGPASAPGSGPDGRPAPARAPATAADDRRAFAIGFALLFPLFVLPLLVTRLVPGLDLPFHLAMVDMLTKAGDPGSPYAAFYEGSLRVSPYLGHLGIVGALVRLGVPGLVAHKLLLGAYVGAMPLSLSRLLASCGRSRVLALLSFPLAYNLTVLYGFISFALSVPLVLWTVSFATELLARPQQDGASPGWRRAAAGLLVSSVALFLCHLQNYLFGLAAVAGGAVLSRTGWRQRLRTLACLVPSLGLLVYWQLGSRYAAGPAAPGEHGPLAALRIVWQLSGLKMNVGPRTAAFHTILLRGFQDDSDHLAAALLMLTLLGYFVLGWVLELRPPRDGAAPQTRWPLTAMLALFGAVAAYFALPHHLREFELMTFYPRFSVLVAALLTLLVPSALRGLPRRATYALIVPALAIGVFCAVMVTRHFAQFGRETADFMAVVAQTPPGGRALGLSFDRRSRVMENESTLVGLPSYYPVLRPAPSSFVEILYCGMRHMPCSVRPGMPRPPGVSPWEPGRLDAGQALPFYDYFFVRSGPPPATLFGTHAAEVEPLARAGTWVVYRKKAP